jgi:RNA polymerase sigma-70 factor, ECF subfamily
VSAIATYLSVPIFDLLSAETHAWSEASPGCERFLYRSITVMRTSDSDDDVTALVERGDLGAAIHHLMKRHRMGIYRYCRAVLRDPVLAEDVCQQIFIQAFRDLPQFHGRSKYRTWLFGIARHRSLDAAKARRRWYARQDSAAATDLPDLQRSPAESLDERRRLEALARGLERLDDRARSAVLLHYRQGFTFQEMAAVCREKPGTLAARVARALPVLRADIESRIYS